MSTHFATSSDSTTHLDIALRLAERGWPVLPLCYPNGTGVCACGHRHTGRAIGKVPITRLAPHGVNSATTDEQKLRRWFGDKVPSANVGIDIVRSGLVVADPDSPAALAEVKALGVPPTIIRQSKNYAYLYRRPGDCPPVNSIHDGASKQLDLLGNGYLVVHGTHRTGAEIYLEDFDLNDAPDWLVQHLREKATERIRPARRRATQTIGRVDGEIEPPVQLHARGLQRWRGALVKHHQDGALDRSASLFLLGFDLAEGNATASAIAAALAERDVTLGWNKYSSRSDAETRYDEIADKAIQRQHDRQAADRRARAEQDRVRLACERQNTETVAAATHFRRSRSWTAKQAGVVLAIAYAINAARAARTDPRPASSESAEPQPAEAIFDQEIVLYCGDTSVVGSLAETAGASRRTVQRVVRHLKEHESRSPWRFATIQAGDYQRLWVAFDQSATLPDDLAPLAQFPKRQLRSASMPDECVVGPDLETRSPNRFARAVPSATIASLFTSGTLPSPM